MKTSTLLLFLISISSYSQITVSGSPNANINGIYNPVAGVPATDCYITFNDAGTNVYQKSIVIPATGSVPAYRMDYYISRRNNYWYIESFSYLSAPHTYYIYYKSAASSTDTNPNCINNWEIWTGSCFPSGAFSLAYTGTNTSLVALSGTCATSPSQASCITPQYIQLPQLTPAQINAITSPTKGMMIFDVTANLVKVFDGASFKTLDYVSHVTLLR